MGGQAIHGVGQHHADHRGEREHAPLRRSNCSDVAQAERQRDQRGHAHGQTESAEPAIVLADLVRENRVEDEKERGGQAKGVAEQVAVPRGPGSQYHPPSASRA